MKELFEFLTKLKELISIAVDKDLPDRCPWGLNDRCKWIEVKLMSYD